MRLFHFNLLRSVFYRAHGNDLTFANGQLEGYTFSVFGLGRVYGHCGYMKNKIPNQFMIIDVT